MKTLLKKILGINSKLPKNYHTDYREDTNQYFWYYLGRKEGGKDYSPERYFSKYDDAVKDAIKHYNSRKHENKKH